MKIFHHNDVDGRCAAAIVKRMIDERIGRVPPDASLDDPPQFIEIDYKDIFDWTTIGFCEAIIIVDFSFGSLVMNEILKQTTNITWIDHHKTAKEYHDRYAEPVKGVQDFSTPGKSGAELTWEYFFGSRPMPHAVKLVGDYDTWRWEYGEEAANFHEGLGLTDQSPTSPIWEILLAEIGDDPTPINLDFDRNPVQMVYPTCSPGAKLARLSITNDGKKLVMYRNNFCKDYCKTYGFKTYFEGYKCYFLNLYRFGSLAFGDRINQYDICISFAYDGYNYSVGLYTARKDLDVSAIAKKYGGGGHQQAAGFVTKELPFHGLE